MQIRDIVTILKTMIATDLDPRISVDAIDETASLFEDGVGLDSVAIAGLMTLIEQRFDFQFNDDDLTLEVFRSLTALATTIMSHMARLPAVSPGSHGND